MRALATLGQWLSAGALVGALCGLASALFLWLLGLATTTREAYPALLFGLPLAGLALGAALDRLSRVRGQVAPLRPSVSLVLERVHDGGPELPLRMAPLVLVGTVLTHLFGGSAGREGTAVQMGASLADWSAHRLRLSPALRRQLLVVGIAGGFASVFGTPIAGLVFALEVGAVGRMDTHALVPALVAAVVGDLTTRGVGIGHAAYPAIAATPLTPALLGAWALFALAIALAAMAFIELTHRIKAVAERLIPSRPLRMAVGGAAVVALWAATGATAHLGLSLPLLDAAFHDGGLPAWTWALKLLFTAVTLGFGFVGGEVTPLFVVGGTLGHALGPLLGIPTPLAAAVGMAALFGAAANTPIALAIMATELCGAAVLPHAVWVGVLAFVATGARSIYPAQRLLDRKWRVGPHGGAGAGD